MAYAVQKAYAPFENRGALFSQPMVLFETAQKTVAAFSSERRTAKHKIEDQVEELKEQAGQKRAALANLRKNIKDYPKGLIPFREELQEELHRNTGNPVKVYILADLLEISDERWRGAVEGYLNNQKFYFLVEPAYYQKALHVYDRMKRKHGCRAFGLVDVGKLREKEMIHTADDSLAKKIETENELARSYVDYLLGRVICCDNVEQLRSYKTAITSEGMLYQGYVARALRRDLMEDVFIGHRAVELRIKRLQAELERLEEEQKHWKPIYENLSGQEEPLFTQRFVEADVAERREDYSRSLDIVKEMAEIDEQMSHLNLLWLCEQRKAIEKLKEEIQALDKKKVDEGTHKGELVQRIHQLEYETLPDCCQQFTRIEDSINETFSVDYQQSVGIPRYQQEFARLRRADAIRKNFGDSLAQSVKARETAKAALFKARRDYVETFKPCSFQTEVMDNEEFEAEQKVLEESELPKYRKKIEAARESALEQFQNDFLAKLKSSIDQVKSQVASLNRALRWAQFGTDKYQFRVDRNPDYADYYDMIMAPELMNGDMGLFGAIFQEKYGPLIDKLFSQITAADDTQLNARKQSELQENIVRYTDFRTYLRFDLETTDQNGTKQLLSQTLNTKSGGETQTPFYIAVLASFAQLYRTSDATSFGNTVRLVVFDEAFNKMDSDRITESVRLLRKMGLQAIVCTPPDKVADIMPIADRTLLVDKTGYRMHIIPFGKENAG